MADSVMLSISQVEKYGRDLDNVQKQMREIFKRLQQETRNTGAVWKDDAFKRFEQYYNENVVKNVNEITMNMEMMANYVAEMVELHRKAKDKKIR